jgi:low affinity Fe/Cu permease
MPFESIVVGRLFQATRPMEAKKMGRIIFFICLFVIVCVCYKNPVMKREANKAIRINIAASAGKIFSQKRFLF